MMKNNLIELMAAKLGYRFKIRILASAALALVSGFVGTAFAVGYSIQGINSPGPAIRMSNNGNVAGFYVAKCVTLSSQPKRTICYNAPWLYDGQHLAKLANKFPSNVNARPVAVNDAGNMVGSDIYGTWYYANGNAAYAVSDDPNISGIRLSAINNNEVAVGMGYVSNVYQPVTYALNDIPGVSPALQPGDVAVDINDAGMITGWFKNNDNAEQSFVADAGGDITPIPNLDPSINCRPVRISQVNAINGDVWVAGNCTGNRPFLYEVNSGSLIALSYPGSSNLSVVSVNSSGEAAGTAVKPGAYAPDGYTALRWSNLVLNDPNYDPNQASNPTDLNANNAFAPVSTNGIAWNVHATDINEAGTILAGYNDISGNFYTFLITPILN